MGFFDKYDKSTRRELGRPYETIGQIDLDVSFQGL